ncbi:undecaprenyl-diphosphate phosphatase [Bacillus sp. UMB0893]|uniref:undecaprenyl-diphosphate phosphatase n=1 Tax=Bacillus sp. UMB0893 TaxID=2066053 RepID=UPI000C7690E6|nr:undecaprenyl-diphosphate phosphatase [Bacillus sp. UMB0893]PLR66385.1 undecaprenyl-diphosphatase [Bacillus sp. UMB0893]QNG58237.1 undecaprenyl-diphosphate phosphatase [Bacillus sp. PAMC26568]
MMEIIIGIIMGIVEGLTEFAPVSSTGHLILVGHLLGFEGTVRATTFEVVIQLGSILAVVALFWKRILTILGIHKNENNEGTGSLSIIHIAIGILPFGLGGVFFYDYIKNELFTPQTVVITLVAGGILMIVAEKFKPVSVSETLDQVSYKQALTVGIFQCLALVPGFSRSGATLSGGLLAGMNHRTASEFTFIMAVPIMFAASGKDLLESFSYLTVGDIPLFVAGFVTAFIVAIIAIKFFLNLINKIKLIPFAIYRFVLAIVFWIFIL